MDRYKLTEKEALSLNPLAAQIIGISKQRPAGKHDSILVKLPLTRSGKIWMQNIQFYGGENFGKPYFFLAEIEHNTTNAGFSRWANKANVPLRHFTY